MHFFKDKWEQSYYYKEYKEELKNEDKNLKKEERRCNKW